MKHLIFVLESLPKVFGNDYNKIILIWNELKETSNKIDQYEWSNNMEGYLKVEISFIKLSQFFEKINWKNLE
jgi:hypothetical protein